VQSLPIVDLLDEDADRLAGVLEMAIISAVDFLLFESYGLPTRLMLGWISWAASTAV
jgi:hypothetical protein